MPERNRQTLKTRLQVGLTALAAVARPPMSEPAGDPAPPPPPSSVRRNRPGAGRHVLVSA